MLLSIKKLYYKNGLFYKLLKPFACMYTKCKNKHQNRLFLKYADDLLCNFSSALNSVDVPFWLEFGTLLGAVRSNDFIPHDLDIDVGMFYTDFLENQSLIETNLKKRGFKKVASYSVDGGRTALENSYSYKGVHIDIFFFRQKEYTFVCHGFTKDPKMSWEETINKYGGLFTLEYSFPKFNLAKYSFRGDKYLIPQNYDLHLKSNYGPDYLIPNAKWDPFSLSDSNIRVLESVIGKVIYYD